MAMAIVKETYLRMALRGLPTGRAPEADLPRYLVVQGELRLVELLPPAHPVDVGRGGGDGAV